MIARMALKFYYMILFILRSTLIDTYGHTTVTLSAANTHSYDKKKITFKEYCDTHIGPQSLSTPGNGKQDDSTCNRTFSTSLHLETFYMFGDNNYDEWSDFLTEYNPPPYTLPKHHPALSFGVAGPGSGVPFHFHGPGFAETIYGRKRWFLTAPDEQPEFHPNKTTLQWLLQDYGRVKDEVIYYYYI